MRRMKRILFAWELGEGFGHIAKTMLVAQALAIRGYEVSFALQTMQHAPLLMERGFPCVQIPRNGPSKRWRKPFNHSGLLLNNGFDSPESLRPTILEWGKLLGDMRPDVLIADHAPTAILASHVAQIPTALMGGGFFCPPAEAPYPNMVPWERRSVAALRAADDEITKVINQALASLPNKSSVESVHDVFDPLPRYICTFQELDHYGRDHVHFHGALFENVGNIEPKWSERYKKKIFIYLTGHPPSVAKLLRTLARIPADVLAVLRGIPEAAIPNDLPSHITILQTPVNAAMAIQMCDLVINHASLGLLSASLVAGTPMLLAPVFLEQSILCRRAVDTGACRQIANDDSEKRLAQVINELLEDNRYKEAAMRFAGKYANYCPVKTAEEVADRVIQRFG
jgi:UDP:flavonoid glycosyltransferase YjiC (YdhE family)